MAGTTELAPGPTGQRGQRLTYLVKQLEMAERSRMEEVLRPLEVTLSQYTLLSLLERREGLSSAQLARRHYVTPQAMHQLVGQMEREGLIERRPDPQHRRILRAWLTPRGGEVLQSCHDVVDAFEHQMLAVLTYDEAVMFGRMLERCIAALADQAAGPS